MISGKVLSCDWVNSHHSNVVFRGELENRFFRAAKDKNKHAHVCSILQKMCVNDRVQAAVKAVKEGLV